jgi:hypothetical protein
MTNHQGQTLPELNAATGSCVERAALRLRKNEHGT